MSVAVTPSTIEHLDWTPILPCEYSQHDIDHLDEPAKYLIEMSPCPGGSSRCSRIRYLICQSGWTRLIAGLVHCRVCDAEVDASRVARIVKEIQ